MIPTNKEFTIGIVKWFANEKGFGVINTVNDNNEIFLHISNWIETKDIGWIIESGILIFQVSLHRDRLTAKKCRYFNYSLEDYQLLVSLTKKYNHFLYARNNIAKKLKISDLLDKNNLKISNFNLILTQEFETIKDDEFINSIDKFTDLYSDILITEEFISNESTKRFHHSKSISFKQELIDNALISIQDVPINFILENNLITKNIITSIKQYPEFIENIISILEQTEDDGILRILISIALEHNIQEVTIYMDLYLKNKNVYDVLEEYVSLKQEIDSSKVDYDIEAILRVHIEEKNDLNLIIEASKYGLNISNHDFVDKYAEQIDLSLFKEINLNHKLDKKVFLILEKNSNQKLLEYIISNIENFELDDYQPFFKIGIKKLFHLSIENQILYIRKIFHLKKLELINFTQYNLELFIDKSILQLAIENKQNIDFSTYLIIDLIVKFDTTNGFMATHEIIKSVLKLIEFVPTRRVQIGTFFDKCNGIAYKTASHTNNIISKVSKERIVLNRTSSSLKKVPSIFEFQDDGKRKNEYLFNIINNNRENSYILVKEYLDDNYQFFIQYCNYRKSLGLKFANKQAIVSELAHMVLKEDNPINSKENKTNDYFVIKFNYDSNIVDDIKKLPVRKYNPSQKAWEVPLEYENEILEFGKSHKFKFDIGSSDNFYTHNSHLVEIVKNEKQKPVGIEYCCGQEAKKKDSVTQKDFWWCNQTQCFANNIFEHLDWKEYTLFDFMKILDLKLQETSNDGGFTYQIGLYTRFVTFLNRFNHLLERLYCRECDHILYPKETSNFHAHSVTKFICKNNNCIKRNKIVYLNNCLNGQCNEIIDSRDSKQCDHSQCSIDSEEDKNNGWYICHKCGSCCSHITFERRLKNLTINGGKKSTRLQCLIQKKVGHLEKAEYFCYQCGQTMREYSQTLYKCNDCKTQYDLSKYSQLLKKQIHLNLRRDDYPTGLHEIINQLKEILFEEKKELIKQGRTQKQIFGILFNKKVEIDGVIVSLSELKNKKLTNEIFD